MIAEIEDNIRKNVPWNQLSKHSKKLLCDSTKEYEKLIVDFSIKNQLRYKGNLVKHVLKDEKHYYERLIAKSKEKLMLFPYHLADMIVKGLRITPFNYYISIIERLVQSERSYDTLPNFTAADCLRLLGIGRNEYLDLMNKAKSHRSRLFGKRNIRALLPQIPCTIHVEPWWRVEAGLILEEDIKMVSPEELELIDKLIDYGSQAAGELDFNLMINLYKKGLVYLDVPVTAVDRIQVPPLQGFVMNRVPQDNFETLLYKIFVSIDEHTTVGELASVIEVETELVKQAVSLYCRLQFARKLEPETEQQKAKRHPSWNSLPAPVNQNIEVTPLTLNFSNSSNELSQDLQSPRSETPESPSYNNSSLPRSGQRIAFLFDSALNALLMMGNLSPGLKKHAVTMFEVGKLCDESLDSFLAELEKVSVLDAEGEGEARRYFVHAVILRSTVLALRKLPSAGLDLIRLESLHSLDEAARNRLIQKKYRLLVSMAPLSREVRPIYSISPPHLGPAVPEINSIWFKFFIYHMTGYGPPSILLKKGTKIKTLPKMFLGFTNFLVCTWLHEPAILPLANFSHVNAALQYSPVLVQAYGVHHPARTHIVPFPFRPDTPSKGQGEATSSHMKWQNHPAIKNIRNYLDLDSSCGYFTFVNIGVPDLGCSKRDPTIHLRKTSNKHVPGSAKQLKSETPNKNAPLDPENVPTAISNENFSFSRTTTSSIVSIVTPTTTTNSSEDVKSEPLKENVDSSVKIENNEQFANGLQSPIDSHFANTPVSASPPPANGFVNQVSTDLLKEELDQLDEASSSSSPNNGKKLSLREELKGVTSSDCSSSFENLVSPLEENINMFSREEEKKRSEEGANKPQGDGVFMKNKENVPSPLYIGEIWTLLDCHFGVPLFDVDANTKICDAIVSGGLAEAPSLENLNQSSQKLGAALLVFISQCQDDNMDMKKRGALIPLPEHCLVFDNGRVTEWTGK